MKSLFAFAFMLASVVAFGQTDKPIESNISQVTVFLSKAQVTRNAHGRIEAGKTNLVLKGLTAQLDPQSIQVAGKGSFVILGISHQQNFINEFNLPKGVRLMKDSVERLRKEVALEQSQKEILNREEQMILANQKIGGNNQNLTAMELKSMADFFRTRLGEIVSSRMKEEEKIQKLNERIARLEQQINSQNDLLSRNTSEIVVSVSAEAATSVDLEVNYVVANAAWNAVYDLRATNTRSPIQLSYKANVVQNTGENWDNVKLTLSTADPNAGGLKPELESWYLNFDQPFRATRLLEGRVMGLSMKSAPAPAAMADSVQKEEVVEAQNTSDFVQTVQTSLNTEFAIGLPYTVPSSQKPTVVDIRSYEVKADYRYSVAPKLDKDAFLMARVTGWEEYSLLPGEANIFFEGTFVAKTYIDPNSIKDTLNVSLGRDKRIVVKREKVKDLTSRKLIGSNQREASAWEISVRNTKGEPVKILVEDQVPVSQNNQIEVTVQDAAGARYNKDTGKLAWEVSLQPNETKKWTFRYEVKYPKDKRVNGL